MSESAPEDDDDTATQRRVMATRHGSVDWDMSTTAEANTCGNGFYSLARTRQALAKCQQCGEWPAKCLCKLTAQKYKENERFAGFGGSCVVVAVVEEINSVTASGTTQSLQKKMVTTDTRAAVAAAKGKVQKTEDAIQGVETVEAVVLAREMQTVANGSKVTIFGVEKVGTVRPSAVSV